MEQTDYLLRQINQLTNLLQKILSNILKLKDQNPSQCLILVQECLKEIVDKDLNQIANLTDEKFIDFINEKKISTQGKKYLAEILNISAELSNYVEQKALLAKALFVYENILKENKSNFSICKFK